MEGHKTAVYPILEWIFTNVDRLKERVYLASFLTRIEVPLEDQSPEVVRLMNTVDQKMEEFKASQRGEGGYCRRRERRRNTKQIR